MVLAILQARMSSTRLRGKVLADLAGAPMVLRQIERLRRCQKLDDIVVAISDDPTDDILAQTLADAGMLTFRGPLHDVLGRFAGALKSAGVPKNFARLTADCPLADPGVIDATIDLFHESGADYVSNTGEHRTFAIGLDVEVCRSSALMAADEEATAAYEREHVTPFIYRKPDRFSIATYRQDADEGMVRWTVDRPDDLAFVRQVYDALYETRPEFTSEHIRQFVDLRPDLANLGGDPRR